jgi:hypothetical protein
MGCDTLNERARGFIVAVLSEKQKKRFRRGAMPYIVLGHNKGCAGE